MKEMVNAFSDYARTPVMRPMSVDLNALVLDVVELYRTASPAVRFETRLERPLAPVHADPDPPAAGAAQPLDERGRGLPRQ